MPEIIMRLFDAEPGTVLLDTCDAEWERTETGAVARGLDPVEWAAEDFGEAEEHFGPFRLKHLAKSRTRAFDLGVRDVPDSERPVRQAEPEPTPAEAEIAALRRSLEEMIGVSTSLYRALRTAGLRVTEGAQEIIERLERARTVLMGSAGRKLLDEVDETS